eukprot:601031-Prorocentrum_minimum.AAC.3
MVIMGVVVASLVFLLLPLTSSHVARFEEEEEVRHMAARIAGEAPPPQTPSGAVPTAEELMGLEAEAAMAAMDARDARQEAELVAEAAFAIREELAARLQDLENQQSIWLQQVRRQPSLDLGSSGPFKAPHFIKLPPPS